VPVLLWTGVLWVGKDVLTDKSGLLDCDIAGASGYVTRT